MSINPARRPIRDRHTHVNRIGEAVAATWGRASSGGTDLQIPVGVMAALALIRRNPNAPDPAQIIPKLDRDQFTDLLRRIWAMFAIMRPDLSPNVAPIRNWLWDGRAPALLDAAKDAAATALGLGILDLYTDPDTRHRIDLFGPLLVQLRPDSAITARGQIHTPPGAAELIARILGPTPHARVYEPAVGTGAMLAAAADTLRAHGRNPADVTWYANDIDPIAVACLAVNAHLWDLGYKVLFAVADTLTGPNWIPAALAARDAAIGELKTVHLISAFHALIDDPMQGR